MPLSRTSKRTRSRASRKTASRAETAAAERAERLKRSGQLLHKAHKQLPLLKRIAWSRDVRDRFFASDAKELPRVEYQHHDVSSALDLIHEARSLNRKRDLVATWVRRAATVLETTALMIARPGTATFSKRSQQIYGDPSHSFPGTDLSPYELAQQLIRTTRRAQRRMPDPPAPRLSAGEAALEMRAAVRSHFGKSAPQVRVVRALAARAAAAPTRIRLRRDARFSDLDVRQLIQHEALVHVASALNGRAQRKLPLLAAGHAGTTRTQEGLAVFAELVSGALGPARLLRIAHRVVAVQMALEGADFLEVYAYFLEHSPDEIEAYESTVRVFRGGLLRGGAPFTKDIVYLDGLCRVHAFLRAAIVRGRVDCLNLLFAGKMDLNDVGAIAELRALKLCRAPRFLPPWIEDPRRLVAYFAVTGVMGRAGGGGLRRHYSDALRATPHL